MSLQNKTFNELITFTRATGGGRFNAAGQYEWLAANQPRFDFDPVTLQPRGILIEEQRTNLLLRSAEFDNPSWTKSGSIVTGNSATAPDGTLSAYKLIEAAINAQHQLRQASVFSDNTTVCASVYLRAAERSTALVGITNKNGGFRVRLFNLANGTNSQPTTPGYTITPAAYGMENVGGGWYRCWVADSVGAGTSVNEHFRTFIYDGSPVYTGDGTSGIFIWGAQLEEGAFPTSYIPTTTAQVTRAADVCSVNNLSPWYRADEGTLFADFVAGVDTRSNVVTSLQGNISESDVIRLRMNSAGILDGAIIVGGVSLANNSLRAITANTQNKAAVTFKVGSSRATVNGAFSDNSSPAALPAVSRLSIGNQIPSGNAINGHIRRIRYIPRRISDTELQALTAI